MKKKEEKKFEINSILFIFKIVKTDWLLFFLIFIVTIFSSILSVANGFFIKNIINLTIRYRYDKLAFYIFFLIEIIILGILIRYWSQILNGIYNNNILKDLRKKIILKIPEIEYSFIESKHTGFTLSRILNDFSVILEFFNEVSFTLSFQFMLLLFSSVYLTFVNFKLFMIIIIITPTVIYFSKYLSKSISKHILHKAQGYDKMVVTVQDAISGINIVKAYNLQDVINQKFQNATAQILEGELNRQKRLAQINPLLDFIPMIPFLIVLIYGGYLTIHSRISVGDFFLFIYLLKYLIGPLSYFPDFINQYRESIVSIDRIKEFFDLPVEKKLGLIFKIRKNKPVIQFDNVSFAYNEKQDILKSMNFTISKNQCIALVGPSGSGKSTIFKLICNFYKNQSGEIKLFDHDINRWDLAFLRSKISIVSQDTYLFPASITDNIRVGDQDAKLKKIIEVAKMANIHDFIMKLPDKYDTCIGDGGLRLSGGESQRLSLARALCKDSEIILLDEPTSSLDSKSEELIQKSLIKLRNKKTIIIIAHRLSTILFVDEIFVLYKGKIVERGTHEALFNINGVYKKLYSNQFN